MLTLPQGIELPLGEYARIDRRLAGRDASGQFGCPIQPVFRRPFGKGLLGVGSYYHAEIEIAVLVGITPGMGAEEVDPADGKDLANLPYDIIELVVGHHVHTQVV
jgi:hypothetical protein